MVDRKSYCLSDFVELRCTLSYQADEIKQLKKELADVKSQAEKNRKKISLPSGPIRPVIGSLNFAANFSASQFR